MGGEIKTYDAQTIDYGRMVVAMARRDYPVLWATVERDFPELPEHKKAWIVSLVTGVCPDCYEDAWGCQCSNEE